MLEKLLLAATVTFSIHFLLPVNSPDMTQTNWQVYSAKNTTTESENLVEQQLLAKIWQPTATQQK
ncbi:hypothetical protein ACE1B6_20605 [Aerosakkonemataceae cyanobacterium BLCC-F154]|uniref:Uncharacterized protein n=1 Tax=Floridaenema fluviatile BLCC-F154 TaxID=3153640 RepID=A0ABV4YFQ4_9CYAN